MQAKCLNEDCKKGKWTLRKAPSEYSRGVSCPECGTTRVEIEGEETAGGTQMEPVDRGGGRKPAPARVEGQGGNAVEAVLTAADGDQPASERAAAAQQAAGAVGGLIGKILEYNESKEMAREEVAERAELERIDKYPECDCGYQFTGEDIDLGSDRVKCPTCGAAYRLTSGQGG